MFGIKTIRQLINDARAGQQVRMTMDELADLYAANNGGSNQTHFLNPQPTFISTAGNVAGLTDRAVSPLELYDMMQKDTYVSGMFDQITESVFKKGWYFAGGKNKGREYAQKLKEMGIDKLMKKRIDALWGAGGGNYIAFTVKQNGKLTIKVFPFLTRGEHRVKVYADDNLDEIYKYEVINPYTELPVFTLDPARDYVEHGRYSESGDYRFSSNPAKKRCIGLF